MCTGRITARLFLLAALGLTAAACGSSTSSSSPVSDPLLDPTQVRTVDPRIHVATAGVNPQVAHLDSPVTVTFVNDDSMAHALEAAPELHYNDCPELKDLKSMAPGKTTTVTLLRGGIICAYHDAARPSTVAFQGLLVVH